MQVQLSGQHLEITEALRNYVHSKLDRLQRLDDRIVNFNVVLCVDKLEQWAEGTLSVAGAMLHAKVADTDMYKSIDAMFDKLVCQLRKRREKLTDKHQREVRLDERRYA